MTEGKPTFNLTAFSNGTRYLKSLTGIIHKDTMTLLLHAEKDFEEWETADNETAQEIFYEVRGDPNKDLWHNTQSNVWSQWVYYTAKQWTSDECEVCPSGKRKLEVVLLPCNTETLLAFRRKEMNEYGSKTVENKSMSIQNGSTNWVNITVPVKNY